MKNEQQNGRGELRAAATEDAQKRSYCMCHRYVDNCAICQNVKRALDSPEPSLPHVSAPFNLNMLKIYRRYKGKEFSLRVLAWSANIACFWIFKRPPTQYFSLSTMFYETLGLGSPGHIEQTW